MYMYMYVALLIDIHVHVYLQTQKKRKGRAKGVQYVDDGSDMADSSLLPDHHGHPTWKIENRNETHSEKHML
jgi:hypothetical protein